MAEREAPSEGSSQPAPEPADEAATEEPRADEAATEEPRADEAATEESTQRSSVDARGLERPRFLLDFPHDPKLDRLIAAFEAGNYAYVRENAERLAENATRDEVRNAARELRRRIEPDPLVKYLVAISILLLLFLVTWAYLAH